MQVQAFIFDLDGVLTDTAEYHYQSWKRLAEEEGIEFTREDNHQLRGVSRRESLVRMLKGREIGEAQMLEWMERKNNYYRAFLSQITPNDLLPGVSRFLQQSISQGIKLGVGSASKNARDVLKSLDILDLFDAVGDGYSVVNSKPAPDLFLWVAGRLNVTPTSAVVFEDAEAGIEAANRGGFYTVGVGPADVSRATIVIPGGLDGLTPTDVINRLNALAPA
jgi:beta-phosphoglucomutase